MVKNLCKNLLVGVMAFTGFQSQAANNYWRTFEGTAAPSRMPSKISASEYRLFTLDQAAMRSFLFGLGENYENGKAILLPSPDGSWRSFHVWKTPMMEEALAKQYPGIQTFTAEADDNHNVTAKIDYTGLGFNAMVYDGDGTYFIDPYNYEAEGYYGVYYKKDYQPTIAHGACELDNTMTALTNGAADEVVRQPGGKTAQKSNGTQRHEYRLALSCTGEYALNLISSNPTVSQILSIMTTTVNRVNGYYEREFSVSFQLVGNNNKIIFIDPATDPYTCNTTLACLIGEGQTVITDSIGSANFDIGHVLCTAGGGLAQVGATCVSGKASGTSTSGGASDVSTMLHELGHQFGANHTFSANTGSCLDNGNELTAYEPGAGISTMSYSGLCSPNNVGSRTDDYFHANTLIEVSDYLTGSGATCGTTSTGTSIVTLPDIADSFRIPKNTPFELTAPIIDPPVSGDTVYYNWEQWDLGNFAGTEANYSSASEGPAYRSYYPTTSRIRPYPDYESVIGSVYSLAGVRLAGVKRTIRFKLTARSIHQGWGVFNTIDTVVRIRVDANSQDFRVTSQSSAVTWTPGTQQTVTWNVGNTTADSVNAGYVNIYLSFDGGENFDYLWVSNAPNTGSYTATVPNVYTTEGYVKVKGAGNVFFDINKAKITIPGDATGIGSVELDQNLSVFPNPASDKLIIEATNINGKNLNGVMYNIVGQKVWSGEIGSRTEIAVGHLARGQYMLQVIDGTANARTTKKVVLK
ncbi:MAG: zinc-dependent metalloprotease family protein [Edaphocola sp.]